MVPAMSSKPHKIPTKPEWILGGFQERNSLRTVSCALVAQLDRAPAFEAGGPSEILNKIVWCHLLIRWHHYMRPLSFVSVYLNDMGRVRLLATLLLIGLLAVSFFMKTGTLHGSTSAEDLTQLPLMLAIGVTSAAGVLVAVWRGWSLWLAVLVLLLLEIPVTLYVLG